MTKVITQRLIKAHLMMYVCVRAHIFTAHSVFINTGLCVENGKLSTVYNCPRMFVWLAIRILVSLPALNLQDWPELTEYVTCFKLKHVCVVRPVYIGPGASS